MSIFSPVIVYPHGMFAAGGGLSVHTRKKNLNGYRFTD